MTAADKPTQFRPPNVAGVESPLLSIVIPVFGEEANIVLLDDAIRKALVDEDDIIDPSRDAWRRLTTKPDALTSIRQRKRAHISQL